MSEEFIHYYQSMQVQTRKEIDPMDKSLNTTSKRVKAIFISIMLPISLLVILGLTTRAGNAESEAAFKTYLANLDIAYSSDSHPMQAVVSSDDVGNPVPPDILSVTTVLTDPLTAVNDEVHFTAVYTDQGFLDTHVAVWDWGDGSITTQTQSGVVSPFQASHIYSQVGIYTVKLVVSNSFGFDEDEFQYVAVYDPSAGFVTGGGWIDSPSGAYQSDPSLTGKATFGFVSKYKKGATAPTGNTEFQFKTADLNFHSDSYDFLVVAGHKALFKGVGTINGTGNYGFMIGAIDENLTHSTEVDLFRIKIWDKDAGDALVYDNQIACSDIADDADPCTQIGGGSIVIHKGK
jgi:hypothetical protein